MLYTCPFFHWLVDEEQISRLWASVQALCGGLGRKLKATTAGCHLAWFRFVQTGNPPPLSFQQEDKDQPLDFGVAYFQIFETIGTSKTIDYVMVFLRVRVRLAWCIQANLVHPRIVRVQPHPLAKMRGEPAANQQSSKNQYRHENYRTQATKMHMIWPPKLRGHWMWHGLACHILRTSHTASRGAPKDSPRGAPRPDLKNGPANGGVQLVMGVPP